MQIVPTPNLEYERLISRVHTPRLFELDTSHRLCVWVRHTSPTKDIFLIVLPKMSCSISCHVLNTLTGAPANDLHATLTHYRISHQGNFQHKVTVASYTATTDADGRVNAWQQQQSALSLSQHLDTYHDGERLLFSIKFDIGPWYEERNIESFWPEIEIKFYVKKGERHYHVPCLVGPWTYTTYRGS